MKEKRLLLAAVLLLFLSADAVSQPVPVPADCISNCSGSAECMSSMASCESYISENGDLAAALESIIRQQSYFDPGIDPAAINNLESSWCSACCSGFPGDGVHPCIFSCPCVLSPPGTNTTINIWEAERRPTMNQSIYAVTDSLNYNFCVFLNIMWFMISGVAALSLISAGLAYFRTSDVARRSRSRKTMIYSVAGLAFALVACPFIDYLIESTDITPFSSSCRCYETMVYREGVSPTLPPLANITTRPPPTTMPPLPNGRPCTRSYQCASEKCSYGFCCDDKWCGYAYKCFDQGEEKPDGEVCDNGYWKKKDGEPCFKDIDCLSGNCNTGFCCPQGDCWYVDRCYADGSIRPVDNVLCRNEVWATTTTTTTSTTSTTIEANVKLIIVFVAINWYSGESAFNAEVDSQVDFLMANLPLQACPSALKVERLYPGSNIPITCECTDVRNVWDSASSIPDKDYVIGLIDHDICGSTVGFTCPAIRGPVIMESGFPYVATHELGHQWSLRDEYVDRCRCEGMCSPNYLDASIGGSDSTPSYDPSYCAGGSNCIPYGSGVTCLANYGRSGGGRCIMGAAGGSWSREFCIHCWSHLETVDQVNCL